MLALQIDSKDNVYYDVLKILAQLSLWLHMPAHVLLCFVILIIFSLLPQPTLIISVVLDDEAETQHQIPLQAVITRRPIPLYRKCGGWKPTPQEDFGWFFMLFSALPCMLTPASGSYPECHVAQYPLNLRKKKVCMSILHSSAYQLIQM